MTEPATDAKGDVDDVFNRMTLQLAKAREITQLALQSESELTTVLAVIRDLIESAEAFADQLSECLKDRMTT
jgi:hypothetical protein